MVGFIIQNGSLVINGSFTVNGIVGESSSTGSSSQVVEAAKASYIPSYYEVANGQSLTIENTAILEVG